MYKSCAKRAVYQLFSVVQGDEPVSAPTGQHHYFPPGRNRTMHRYQETRRHKLINKIIHKNVVKQAGFEHGQMIEKIRQLLNAIIYIKIQ